MSQYKVDLIDDIQNFKHLEPAWNDLLNKASATYPFLTFEWQFSWWKNFGRGYNLRLFTIKNEKNELVAIIPLYKRKFGPFQIWEFIGSDRSDYLDFITYGKRGKILESFLEHLKKITDWDVINFQNICFAKDEMGKMEEIALKSQCKMEKRVYMRSPFLGIEGDWDSFLKGRGGDFRKKIRKLERRLKEKGKLEVIRENDFISQDKRIGQIHETAKEIESRSWKFKHGNPRILTDEHSQAFYRDFLELFSKRKWLDSWFVISNGTPIAYAFNFNYGGKIFAYNGAYDERFKEYGPGSVLHIERIRDAFNRSMKEYDFLRGEEDYKKVWTKTNRDLMQAVIIKQGLRGKLAWLFSFKLRWFLGRFPLLQKLRLGFGRIIKGKWKS